MERSRCPGDLFDEELGDRVKDAAHSVMRMAGTGDQGSVWVEAHDAWIDDVPAHVEHVRVWMVELPIFIEELAALLD